jgi:hypothetical protein
MRTFILLLFGGLLASAPAAAQPTFNGYYIDNNGDTIAVTFPKYRQWKNSPAQIQVRSAGGREVLLTPGNAREVTIEGYDTYRSRHFTRLINPFTNTNYYNLSPLDSIEEVHGFLFFLAGSGGVSLYKYSDHKRENFFLETGDSLIELKHKIFLNENNSQIIEDNRFRQQLFTVLYKSGLIDAGENTRVERIEYKEDQLKALIKRSDVKKERKQERYPSDLVVLGGVAYNTFSVSSKSYSSNSTRADYNNTFSPVVGLAFFDYSQRGFGRNFLTLQLMYYSFKNTGNFTAGIGPQTVTYSANVFNLGVGIGHSFIHNQEFSAYAAIIPTMVYMPDNKEQYSYMPEQEKRTLLSYNFSLQAGLRLPGSLGVWARYHVLPIDVQRYVFFSNQHRTLQLGMDWKLKKHK